jgi:heat shock protein HslJ
LLRVAVPFLLVAVLAACGGSDDSDGAPAGNGGSDTLTGVTWQWQGSQYSNDTDATPEDPSKYTIAFAEDGTYQGMADCNGIGGEYTLEDSSITISPGPTTLIACPDGSLGSEFTRDLEAAAIVFFQEGDLLIDLFADAGTMRFSPAP